MKIYIIDNVRCFSNSQDKKTLIAQAKTILKNLGLTENTELCITLTDDETMRSLNRTYRGIQKTTDVLSFPQEERNPASLNTAIVNQTNKEILLGDIIISLKTADKNAKRFGISIKDEITKLLVHGILHLTGYNHKKTTERKTMREKEKELLKLIQPGETDA